MVQIRESPANVNFLKQTIIIFEVYHFSDTDGISEIGNFTSIWIHFIQIILFVDQIDIEFL